MEGHGLMDADIFGKSDPYAIIYCQKESQKSKVIDGTTHPLWNQSFTFNVDSEITDIFVKLFDKDDLGADDPLGSFVVPLNKVFTEGHVPPTRYKVTGPLGQPQGEVSLALKFTPWC
ncbi:hypothetical protein KP509_11G054800 [Ceratopteris richardii]|nr:hypothetical protein KP509_11G054800 [Ceratopteris richardii]